MPAPGTRVNVTPDQVVMTASAPLKINAIAYVRVSKAREIMFSPEQQLMRIRDYCALHGIKIVDVVEDLDESGRSNNYEKRKITGIIERVRSDEANAVVVWKFSRFGRSLTKNRVYIELLKEAGGNLLSATEVGNEDTGSGRFTRDVTMAVDELLAAQIAENWKNTFERRRNSGLPHTGRPPFGYMRCEKCHLKEEGIGYAYCEHCKGIFVVDPVRGPALKEMYQRFIAGESMNKLVIEMTERGITSVKGAPMGYKSWWYALDSGFAAGLLRSRSEHRKRTKANGNVFENWDVWTQGAHDALITMAEWDAYKRLRLARQKVPARSRNPSHTYTGLLRCNGHLTDGTRCLRALSVAQQTWGGKKYFYYRCPTAQHERSCNGRGISEKFVDDLVYAWLLDQIRDESKAEAAMLDAAKADQARTTIEDMDAEIEKIKAEQVKIAKGWTQELLSDELYRELREDAEERLEAALTRRDLAKQVLAVVTLGPDDYRPIAENWPHATDGEKNEFLRLVIDHILLVEGGKGAKSVCRIVPKGEQYDYEIPSRGKSRRATPAPEAASR